VFSNLFAFISKIDDKVALCPPKLLTPFKLKAFRNRVLTIFFAILLTLSTLYSKNLALSFGIGLPELLNVGIGFGVSKTQVNLNAGSAPFWSNEKTYAFSSNLLYPGIQNNLSLKKHTWFVKAGLTYLFDETPNFKDEYLYLNANLAGDDGFPQKLERNWN